MPTVNPDILIWARETAGYDVLEAAKKLQIHDTKSTSAVEKLEAYEKGKHLSRSLLLRMAKQYRRPLLIFYLKEPPRKGERGEDFRTLHADLDPSEDAIVDALVRDIKVRQSIVREALITEGETDELVFVDSCSMEPGIEPVVSAIREITRIDIQQYRNSPNQDEAFKYLRSRIESIGVFTILAGNLGSYHTNLDTKIFRGFALSDDIAPFIVINDQDSKTAWSFTLMHEVAHLWLGVTGISGATAERTIERFCNDVASEILLPEAEMARVFLGGTSNQVDALVSAIDEFANPRILSPRLVAYRLQRSGLITQGIYHELALYFNTRWRDSRDKQRERAKKSDGGPSYYVVKRFQLGGALLNLTERMLSSGELSTTKVATVLGVRALKVGNMFSNYMVA